MIKGCKICGIKDSDTLNYIINHPYPPKFIGFICNYPKSSRYVELKSLRKLLNVKKNKSEFVAVLVKPKSKILEEIKSLPFDYYQLYDCSPDEIKIIKQKYQKKIISALTIKDRSDVLRYKSFADVTDIYLFDSKGYEKSQGFDHNLIKNIKLNRELMLAGNIKFDDNLKNYEKISNYLDLSGGLETSGLKDTSKINIFLNNLNKLKNET
ncbi:phosphoribosylanthranilate isomerase [Candidatus Pelagibacter sp. HIMB1483]|uniref:phosphoribosylanthranilate isomerase n=1 Tax=Candidatus Pelagibacter sp. HIMB1483 TaxID=3415414 RepID=UPI003F860907